MARPIPVRPPPKPLLDRARESLAESGGSIFGGQDYKTFRNGVPTQGEWRGREVSRWRLHKGTLSGWIVRYVEETFTGDNHVNVWTCQLPADLTPEEAEQAAENVMHLINIRRRE